MPHISSVYRNVDGGLYKLVCENCGIQYIDPRVNFYKGVDETVNLIIKSKLLITEAFHGAVVAAAYGIPWIPVVSNREILEFKWRDWCSTIGAKYEPVFLPLLRAIRFRQSGSFLRKIKKECEAVLFERKLKKIATKHKTQVIDPGVIAVLFEKLEEKLDSLKHDIFAGSFGR